MPVETVVMEFLPRCRACQQTGLRLVLDCGELPLANALLDETELARPEERFPLRLFFCPHCTLVQIDANVPPEKLFAHYLYASSFSDTMLAHAAQQVRRLTAERGLGAESLVVEVASNDGYLLKYYREQNVPVLGIEPAANIAALARERGIPTLVEFFDAALGERLAAEGRRADIVHANNVFAHVPDPNGFVVGLRHLLKPGAVAVIEAPYVRDMIDKLEFDTIYHEHFSYFSLTAVENLCRRHDMRVVDVEREAIHGGSLRYFIGHAAQPAHARVASLIDEEQSRGLSGFDYYESFARRVTLLGKELLALLRKLKAGGQSLAAYGASAKGSTLMNMFGIDAALLDFVVDRSTLKQNKFTPGNHLPIFAPAALTERRPDAVLLLAWNFIDEILRQQQPYRNAGGRFIIPVPRPTIV